MPTVSRLLVISLMLLASSCVPAGPGDNMPIPKPGARSAFVMTSDYSDSIVARVDLDSGEVYDGLAAFPAGDMILEAEGDDIYVLSRSGEDVIRRYPGGDFSQAPDLEVSTGAGSNPHALTLCAGRLWLSLYNRSELIALDPASGELLQTVDLHEFDEGEDDSCEPSSIVRVGDGLYVALERFDLQNMQADPQGRVLQLSCDDGTVLNQWTTGPSPRILQDPRQAGSLLVKEGEFYRVDGGVRTLQPASGEFSDILLSEAELDADLGGLTAGGDHLVSSSWAFGDTPALSALHCLNRETGELLPGPAGLRQNLWHLGSSPNGTAWATLSPSAADPGSEHGILLIDPVTCSAARKGLTSFLLPPTHIVFVESQEIDLR